MKRAYTQFRSAFHKLRIAQGLSPEELIDHLTIKYEKRDPLVDSPTLFLAVIDYLVEIGNAEHLFLPDREFCDWLVSCVSQLNPAHARAFQQRIGEKVATVLHFPSSAKLYSCAFCVTESRKEDDFKVSDALGCSMSMDTGEDSWIAGGGYVRRLDGEAEATAYDYYVKLFCGVAMYVDVFPETLIQGLPQDLKHPSHHKYSAPLTLEISEKVRSTGAHDSPTPHYRVGHFRVLRSEKFTKKRFQTVFVHGTFVRGKAETVLSPEQIMQEAAD